MTFRYKTAGQKTEYKADKTGRTIATHFLSCQGNGGRFFPLPTLPILKERAKKARGRTIEMWNVFEVRESDTYVIDWDVTPLRLRMSCPPHSSGARLRQRELLIRGETNHQQAFCQRLITTSLTTLPLGPKGFCGLPFNSARTPPALPSVTVNWSWAFHCAFSPGRSSAS